MLTAFGARAQATVAFSGPFNYPVNGTNPDCVAVADFNGDGYLDLVVGNSSSGTFSILLGTGDGTFQPARVFDAGATPLSVAVGDFNGDGKTDIALAGRSSAAEG